MKFDLVVQGPLNKTSIDRIDDISDQFESVIISHWSENDSSLLENLQSKNIGICKQPTPDRSKTVGVMKNSTFFYSISSTYMGLQRCESKYTIKMRGDEIYTDFLPLKEKFLKDDSKFVFGNIFAKPWSINKYHIGDHLFVAKTSLLVKTYSILFNTYTRKGNLMHDSWAVQGFPKHQTAEYILASAFLKAKEIDKNQWDSFSTFKDNFDVIDINSLGEYIACWKHGNTIYAYNKNPFVCSVNTIEDMK